jgi:hypothetical protein
MGCTLILPPSSLNRISAPPRAIRWMWLAYLEAFTGAGAVAGVLHVALIDLVS